MLNYALFQSVSSFSCLAFSSDFSKTQIILVYIIAKKNIFPICVEHSQESHNMKVILVLAANDARPFFHLLDFHNTISRMNDSGAYESIGQIFQTIPNRRNQYQDNKTQYVYIYIYMQIHLRTGNLLCHAWTWAIKNKKFIFHAWEYLSTVEE